MVTHLDHDHVEGILELLQKFPPNKPPVDNKAVFKIIGPLLITKYFEKTTKGKELIDTIKTYSFDGKDIVDNLSNAGFGSNFDFYFLADEKGSYNGLTYTFNPPKMVNFSLAFSAPPTHAARHTVDDAEANRSSIITVWKDPDPTKEDYQLVLTGDSIAYRIQQVLKPSTAGKGKNVIVFQVPHHGSARNSLPLEKNVLPPTDDITLVKQVFAFRILLAYKFDWDKWDQIVTQEIKYKPKACKN